LTKGFIPNQKALKGKNCNMAQQIQILSYIEQICEHFCLVIWSPGTKLFTMEFLEIHGPKAATSGSFSSGGPMVNHCPTSGFWTMVQKAIKSQLWTIVLWPSSGLNGSLATRGFPSFLSSPLKPWLSWDGIEIQNSHLPQHEKFKFSQLYTRRYTIFSFILLSLKWWNHPRWRLSTNCMEILDLNDFSFTGLIFGMIGGSYEFYADDIPHKISKYRNFHFC
jgi:hypothetical protein